MFNLSRSNKVFTFCIFTYGIFLSFNGYSQIFEGSITYKTEVAILERLSDDVEINIRKDLEKDGASTSVNYYKKGNYASITAHKDVTEFHVFNPIDGLIYAWTEGNNTALTHDFENHLESEEKVQEIDTTQIILGIECKGLVISAGSLTTAYWYNTDYFRMDTTMYQQNQYAKQIGCFPFKVETATESVLTVNEMVNYREIPLSKDLFKIPAFDVITPY